MIITEKWSEEQKHMEAQKVEITRLNDVNEKIKRVNKHYEGEIERLKDAVKRARAVEPLGDSGLQEDSEFD